MESLKIDRKIYCINKTIELVKAGQQAKKPILIKNDYGLEVPPEFAHIVDGIYVDDIKESLKDLIKSGDIYFDDVEHIYKMTKTEIPE